MTTSEPGPELDRRVAEVMGVKPGQVCSDHSSAVTAHFYYAYSTDPARIAEMHTWIAGKCATVAFWWSSIDREWAGAASATPVELIMSGAVAAPQPIEVVGKTIEHALALLVVAVGGA